ncbi:hypothetical protein [Micromonospora sp. NPDC005237]|uniref:hypothetical protein n=1 Tax=Micromonospora sp. NPDC005237 TaxID=3155113 RepID=UPI00339E27DC
MRELLDAATRQRLSLAEYDADFYATVESTDGPILKSERTQTFREPGSPRWEAYADGQWEELRIAAEPNPEALRPIRAPRAEHVGPTIRYHRTNDQGPGLADC